MSSNPSDRYQKRPVVSLEATDGADRVGKLVDAAIKSGKRNARTVALYAGISEPAAIAALKKRGIE